MTLDSSPETPRLPQATTVVFEQNVKNLSMYLQKLNIKLLIKTW